MLPTVVIKSKLKNVIAELDEAAKAVSELPEDASTRETIWRLLQAKVELDRMLIQLHLRF